MESKKSKLSTRNFITIIRQTVWKSNPTKVTAEARTESITGTLQNPELNVEDIAESNTLIYHSLEQSSCKTQWSESYTPIRYPLQSIPLVPSYLLNTKGLSTTGRSLWTKFSDAACSHKNPIPNNWKQWTHRSITPVKGKIQSSWAYNTNLDRSRVGDRLRIEDRNLAIKPALTDATNTRTVVHIIDRSRVGDWLQNEDRSLTIKPARIDATANTRTAVNIDVPTKVPPKRLRSLRIVHVMYWPREFVRPVMGHDCESYSKKTRTLSLCRRRGIGC